tara:strand:+ start:78 stop:581 length:504 start_codon:yes stop_codon:yes gene_type:complete
MLLFLLASVPTQLPGQHPTGQAESYSPLIQALVDGDVPKAEELIAAGADVAALDVITPLYAAQEYVQNKKARFRVMKKLLKAGAPVDQATQDNTTTLMLAAYHGDMKSVQLLLDEGADPLLTNHMMANSINAARSGNHHELAEQLLEHVGESGARHHHDQQAAKTEL